MRNLFARTPISVLSDRSTAGSKVVAREMAASPDVVVFDFPHSAVLASKRLRPPSVLFTHNVEAEIFRRQIDVTTNAVTREIWRNQHAKMVRFERETLARFDTVIAVSERDAQSFRTDYGTKRVEVIPTGVDLDFFDCHEPGSDPKVVFIGSMDWFPNQDGIEWLYENVWPRVAAKVADAKMVVIGRKPPETLVRKCSSPSWRFTGFVDDIRPEVAGAAACVIPLHVGSGTRIKAYEAMAQGAPVISTTLGVEGLPLEPGRHYLRADTAEAFASALIELLGDRDQQLRLSKEARTYVEQNFSSHRVAEVFERICIDTATVGVMR